MPCSMAREKENKDTTISIAHSTKTRLDAYKAKLIGQRGTAKLSFDDIINEFLDSIDSSKKEGRR